MVAQLDGIPAPGGGAAAGGGGGSGAGSAGGASSLSAAELMEAKVIFSKHDVNKDGYITTRELTSALKDLHLPTDTTQAVSTLHEFDKNSDGRLDLPEFALLLRKLRSLQGLDPASTTASLRASFRAYDARGIGSISVADVRPALMRSGVDTSSGVAAAIFSSLSDQPKTNIDFAQFQRIAHAITSAGQAAPSVGSRPYSASPYGAPALPAQGGPAAPTRSAYPPTSAYPSAPYPSAYPPGYKPTELGGPAVPSCGEPLGSAYSPTSRAQAAKAAGGSPDKRAAAEEARRLARRPTAEPSGALAAAGPSARRKL